MDTQLFEAVDHYINALFVREDEALREATVSLEKAGMPAISISPNQGKLLHIFALLCHAKNILEMGTLAGYSSIWLARALPQNGKLVTIEFDPRHADVAQKNIQRAGLATKVDIRVGKALDILPQLEKEQAGPFDMIFIDADKEPYAAYFVWALRLSRPGTLIIADNVIREGQVLDPDSSDTRVQGVQRFNQLLAATDSVTASIFQTIGTKEHDGMAIAIVGKK